MPEITPWPPGACTSEQQRRLSILHLKDRADRADAAIVDLEEKFAALLHSLKERVTAAKAELDKPKPAKKEKRRAEV